VPKKPGEDMMDEEEDSKKPWNAPVFKVNTRRFKAPARAVANLKSKVADKVKSPFKRKPPKQPADDAMETAGKLQRRNAAVSNLYGEKPMGQNKKKFKRVYKPKEGAF